MSWLARSIANTLHLDDDDNDLVLSHESHKLQSLTQPINLENQEQEQEIDLLNDPFDNIELGNASCGGEEEEEEHFDDGIDQGRGVKEDLSELTETLTRQFWGVASFLAPPPPPPPPKIQRGFVEEVEENGNADDEDLRSNGDRFNVEGQEEEDSRSCYYNSEDSDVGDQEEVEDAIGVTEEALTFAQNIGHHPETWLDFPLEEEEEQGFEDFHISDSQYKHALAIQRLVPTLAALRIELCPVHMSEGYFWMVYFVLLHSRLNKHDAEQLSSSELIQARSMWREELQKRAKLHKDWFDRSTFHMQDSTLSPREDSDPELLEDSDSRHLSFNTYNAGSRPYHEPSYNETDKQKVESDNAMSAETPSGNSERDLPTFQSAQILQEHDDEDDWLQETSDLDGYSTTGIMVNEEDVSFSDLEEDSDWTLPVRSK